MKSKMGPKKKIVKSKVTSKKKEANPTYTWKEKGPDGKMVTHVWEKKVGNGKFGNKIGEVKHVKFVCNGVTRTIISERRPGESKQDQNKRIEIIKKTMIEQEREKNKTESKKKVVKGKVVGYEKMMRKVEFKRGDKSMLITSEKRKGESKQDQNKRIEIMKKAMADQSKENLDSVK